MTITYFLMLLFVFWTLWLIANNFPLPTDKYVRIGASFGRVVWAALGTLFFHNVW